MNDRRKAGIMKKNYQLIAFDMDGTLLDSKKKISAATLEMIHAAAKQGKTIALSTGRSLAELGEHRKILSDVRYSICASGAHVVDLLDEKKIYTCPISPEDALAVLDAAEDQDLMFHMLADRSYVQADQLERMADYNMGIYQEPFHHTGTPVDDIRAFYRDNRFPLYKLNLYNRGEAQRRLMEKRLLHLGLTMTDSEISSLECSAPGISKGYGLIKLCEYLNIPVEETIAVGDADNDINILETAGLAVAMGNANDKVKAIADVVVADNDHDGCAEAIRKYLL